MDFNGERMVTLADYPLYLFALSLIGLALAIYLGTWLSRVQSRRAEDDSHLSQITGATISILALLLGFSYSAAISRYDLRKTCEQEEASAISSEYTLAGLLPNDDDVTHLRALLKQFIQLRIAYYETKDYTELAGIRAERVKVEAQMWPIVERNAKANPTPIMREVVAGMDKVLNRPSYSFAAANDRIPDAVWTLLSVLAFFCCALIGYMSQRRGGAWLRLTVPIFLATSFFVIATLDSQRRGVIRVRPENLIRVQGELEQVGM